MGYFKDDYSHYFLKNKKKMLPIINRGTWARVQGVRQVLTRYLKTQAEIEGKLQIISLGAGYDTTFFWIQDMIISGQLPESLREKLVYVEVDYFDVVYKKQQTLKKTEALAKHLWQNQDLVKQGFEEVLDTPHYKILTGDLRQLDHLQTKFVNHQIDPSSSTFVLTECLLVYLKPDECLSILSFLSTYFTSDLYLLNYEMINPSDPFGRVMLENLEDRGCRLQGIHACPDEAAQQKRMKETLGMEYTECYNMSTVYMKKLQTAERNRIEKIEIFDEFEEWELLQSHYCLALGKRVKNIEQAQNVYI